MKNTLLATSLILAGLVAPALSDDNMASIGSSATYDWSGAYVGGHIGYSWTNGADSLGGTSKLSGFLGGIHVGYNVVHDRFLVGAELDGAVVNADVISTFNNKFSTEWFASARLRAGFTADRILFYAAAGVSAGGLELTSMSSGATDSNTHLGWVAGVGAEAFITENISARLEYQHHDFGKETYNVGSGNFQLDGDVDLIKAGISFHF